MLAFLDFSVPHTGTATALVLHEQIENWSRGIEMIFVITENTSDMTNDLPQLHALLKNFYPSSYSTLSILHI